MLYVCAHSRRRQDVIERRKAEGMTAELACMPVVLNAPSKLTAFCPLYTASRDSAAANLP